MTIKIVRTAESYAEGFHSCLDAVARERRHIALVQAPPLERIELDVFASNKPAIALYEKLGFTREGIKRGARKIDGVSDDVVLMALS